jgi:hypothetical protein
MVQVPAEGSDAPDTVTWSVLIGVTGKRRGGTPVVPAVTWTASTSRGSAGPPPSGAVVK